MKKTNFLLGLVMAFAFFLMPQAVLAEPRLVNNMETVEIVDIAGDYSYYSTDGKIWVSMFESGSNSLNVTTWVKTTATYVYFSNDPGVVLTKDKSGKAIEVAGVFTVKIPEKDTKLTSSLVGKGKAIDYQLISNGSVIKVVNNANFPIDIKVGLNKWVKVEAGSYATLTNPQTGAKIDVRRSSSDAKMFSDAFLLSVPALPAAPKLVADQSTSTIKGISATYEYAVVKRTKGSAAARGDELEKIETWSQGKASFDLNLTEKDLETALAVSSGDEYAVFIRKKATATSPASQVQVVYFPLGVSSASTPVADTDYQVDYNTAFIYSLNASTPCQYSVDQKSWKDLPAKDKAINLGSIIKTNTATTNVYIRKKAVMSGSTLVSPASMATTVTLNKMASAPKITSSNASAINAKFTKLPTDSGELLVAYGATLVINQNTTWVKISELSEVAGELDIPKNGTMKYAFRYAPTEKGELPSLPTAIITVTPKK